MFFYSSITICFMVQHPSQSREIMYSICEAIQARNTLKLHTEYFLKTLYVMTAHTHQILALEACRVVRVMIFKSSLFLCFVPYSYLYIQVCYPLVHTRLSFVRPAVHNAETTPQELGNCVELRLPCLKFEVYKVQRGFKKIVVDIIILLKKANSNKYIYIYLNI